jgi:hypothetical protein
MKIKDNHFSEVIAALNKANDRLATECQRTGNDAMTSVWMEIQVIGNVVTAMYRDFYEQQE